MPPPLSQKIDDLKASIDKCCNELQANRVWQAKHDANAKHLVESVDEVRRTVFGNGNAGLKTELHDIKTDVGNLAQGQEEIKANCRDVRKNCLACPPETTIRSILLKAMPTVVAAGIIAFIGWLLYVYQILPTLKGQ